MVSEISGSGESFLQQRVEKLFSKADLNSDGSIDKSEFQQLFSKMLADKSGLAQAPGQSPDKLFAAMDTNNDGVISKDEFTQFAKTHKHHGGVHGGNQLAGLLTSTDDDADDVFSAIDTNGDGVISLNELIAYMSKQAAAAGQSA
jgi:Ca2+-binding EF-hand superfamily protein